MLRYLSDFILSAEEDNMACTLLLQCEEILVACFNYLPAWRYLGKLIHTYKKGLRGFPAHTSCGAATVSGGFGFVTMDISIQQQPFPRE